MIIITIIHPHRTTHHQYDYDYCYLFVLLTDDHSVWLVDYSILLLVFLY